MSGSLHGGASASSWSAALDLGAGNFSAYSSLARLDASTLLCLWESGDNPKQPADDKQPGSNLAIALAHIKVRLKANEPRLLMFQV